MGAHISGRLLGLQLCAEVKLSCSGLTEVANLKLIILILSIFRGKSIVNQASKVITLRLHTVWRRLPIFCDRKSLQRYIQ